MSKRIHLSVNIPLVLRISSTKVLNIDKMFLGLNYWCYICLVLL